LEDALAISIEDKGKCDEQAALDREVIAYLDSKTQELEEVMQKCAVQNEEYKNELDRLQREHEAKSQVISCSFFTCTLPSVILFLPNQVIEDMINHLTSEKKEIETQSKVKFICCSNGINNFLIHHFFRLKRNYW